jgi:hypothetical protein
MCKIQDIIFVHSVTQKSVEQEVLESIYESYFYSEFCMCTTRI